MGRDITFDQQGKYNLRIRKTLEAIYRHYKGISGEAIERDTETRKDSTTKSKLLPFCDSEEFKAFEVYLKRVWFANGIHHHYGCEEIITGILRGILLSVDGGNRRGQSCR